MHLLALGNPAQCSAARESRLAGLVTFVNSQKQPMAAVGEGTHGKTPSRRE